MMLLDKVKKITASKDKKIVFMESEVKNAKKIDIDIVNFTSKGIEWADKQPRAGNTPKIILVILRRQNKKLVQVKQEKNAAMITLNSV